MSKEKGRSAPPPLVGAILKEQRHRWRNGERILVETFLKQLPNTLAAEPGILLDLIYQEIVLREEVGDQPQPAEYLHRFPHLKVELAMQFEVDRGLDWQIASDGTDAPTLIGPLGSSLPRVTGSAVTSELTLSTPPGQQPLPGKTTPPPGIAGYGIDRILGRGLTGVVYKLRQLNQDRSVAVKVVLTGVRQPAQMLARLCAESLRLAELHHPHLCPIHEIGMDTGRIFIAQERVENSLARNVIDATPLQAAEWLQTLATTIHDIHGQGIAHGNLTLHNVLVSFNGILKITDIGVAHYARLQKCWPSAAPLDPRIDVHALGVLFYTLLVGIAPNAEFAPPAKVRSAVPQELDAICMRCFGAEPDNKYSNAGELADDLSAYLAGKPVQGRRSGFAKGIMGWFRKKPPAGTLLRPMPAPVNNALLPVVCRLMRNATRDEVVRHVGETAAWLTRADSVIVFLVDRERKELVATLVSGQDTEELRLALDAGVPGGVASTGLAVLMADARSDSSFDPIVDRRTGAKTRTLLAMPIITVESVVLGVVQAINKRDGAFTQADVDAMSELLCGAAVALERAT